MPPRDKRTVTFLLSWHFPNRMTWTPQKPAQRQGRRLRLCAGSNPDRIGNYYATQYARRLGRGRQDRARGCRELERKTRAFVRRFCDSDLPAVVKEAALFNLSTLRTQTCFRTADGRLFGWEGCNDKAGCCHGSCTHVWNYEQATAFLFGDLARTMREVEFAPRHRRQRA